MRKSIIGWIAGFILAASAVALGQAIGGLPFQLQNNTTADASQVMSNFNTIVSGVNSYVAKKGVNSDITQLTGLTTPLSPSQGGTQTYVSAVATTGSANAQVVASTTPAFTLSVGSRVQFISGFTNTAQVTLTIGSIGPFVIVRQLPGGLFPTNGGELVANSTAEVAWNGTFWELLNNFTSPVPTGAIFYTAGGAAPSGYFLAQGQAVSRTTYSSLFGLIGTTYGIGDGSSTFNIPDARGRYLVAVDAGAGRASSCGTGVLSNTCGANTLAIAQLPAAPPFAPTVTITDPGHTHSYTAVQTSGATSPTGVGQSVDQGTTGATTGSNTTGITAALNGNLGQGQAYYPNTIVLNGIIKY